MWEWFSPEYCDLNSAEDPDYDKNCNNWEETIVPHLDWEERMENDIITPNELTPEEEDRLYRESQEIQKKKRAEEERIIDDAISNWDFNG
jgi:hypothetical protein